MMDAPLDICMIGTWPAVDLLPVECVKLRYRERKPAHPTSWLRALVLALVSRDDVGSVRVLVDSREVGRPRTWSEGKLTVCFIPKFEPGQSDPYHLYWPARIRFAPWLRRLNPAIVHGHGTENANGWLAASSGYPNVVTLQGVIGELAPYLGCSRSRARLLAWMERRAVRRCDGLIVKSAWAREWAERHRSAGIRCIANVVSPEFLSAQSDYACKTCVCIGTLTAFKNPSMVLRAFARVGDPGARLEMIGDGPLRASCEALARELGIAEQTVFRGRLGRGDVVDVLASARCLAIGSRVDTSPNVIAEAMAMGVPVIGTRAGGIPGMVSMDLDGYLVDVDDADAMARYMRELLANPTVAARLGIRGMARVHREHDTTQVAQAHMDCYKAVMKAYNGMCRA